MPSGPSQEPPGQAKWAWLSSPYRRGTKGTEKFRYLTKATWWISAEAQNWQLLVQDSFLSHQLTHRKSVHPASSVGRELHGHSRGGKGVDERPLGCVSPRSNMQHGLCAAYVEPPRRAGVSLRWLHHVLQDVCQLS